MLFCGMRTFLNIFLPTIVFIKFLPIKFPKSKIQLGKITDCVCKFKRRDFYKIKGLPWQT